LDEIYSGADRVYHLSDICYPKRLLLSSLIENRVREGRWLDGIDSAGWTHTRHYLHSQVAGGNGNFIFDPGHLVKNSISIAAAATVS
jgi:hypothetical protein